MKTLIRGGIVCLEGGPWKGDLLVTNETITSLSESYSGDYDRLVEAEGMYVCPGGIDVHTHMSLQQSPRYRSCDDFYSGGAAAACGGTTTIIDHMSFGVPGAPLMDKFEEYRGLAADCPVDYSFHGVFTRVDGAVLEELREIITKKGFPSFKAYTTYAYPMEDRDLLQILHVIRETGGLLCVHAENDAITNLLKERFAAEGGLSPIHQALSRPAAAEAETVARLLRLAEIEDEARLYIVHLSAGESLDAVAAAREKGQKNIFVETCTQYLMLTEDKFREGGDEEGIKYILAPPFRKQKDIDRLWRGLANEEIQVVATDHCPFLPEEKLPYAADYRGCPGGIAGVEERMPILFSEGVQKGRISLARFVALTASNPAKIFGLYPKKGTLFPGADADIVIIDPARSRVFEKSNLHTRAGYSAYEGLQVDCVMHKVFCRGQEIAADNRFLGKRGGGRLLFREPAVKKGRERL